MSLTEHAMGGAVHRLDVAGALAEQDAPDLDRRLRAAVDRGVRWLVVDLGEAGEVADGPIGVLLAAGRDLRAGGGELVLAGAPPAVRRRIEATDRSQWPVLVRSVAELLMILKMEGGARGGATPRAAQRIPALMLPRLDRGS